LFGNAFLLAGNRGLLESGGAGDLARRRRQFADEMAAAVAAVAAIDEYDQHVRNSECDRLTPAGELGKHDEPVLAQVKERAR
jgi:hypothetical protein